jgi:hypothetical protein
MFDRALRLFYPLRAVASIAPSPNHLSLWPSSPSAMPARCLKLGGTTRAFAAYAACEGSSLRIDETYDVPLPKQCSHCGSHQMREIQLAG